MNQDGISFHDKLVDCHLEFGKRTLQTDLLCNWKLEDRSSQECIVVAPTEDEVAKAVVEPISMIHIQRVQIILPESRHIAGELPVNDLKVRKQFLRFVNYWRARDEPARTR